MSNQSPAQEPVAAELAKLPTCSIQDLRNRWRNLFKSKPSKAFGFDLLRRTIAQRLQENAFGKLSTTTQRELNRIIALLEKSPKARLKMPTHIKSGAMLVRDWKDKTYRVMVLDDGYAYAGHTYASLTEIARDITGTHWNGPRFFGLRPNDKKSTDEIGARKRERPPKQVNDAKSPSSTKVDHDA
jgi:hypothetical protein